MKILGERISIVKKQNLLSIVILATNDKRKLAMMFLWLLAWSVCGVIVMINYFQISNEKAKLFLLIYLSFWAYFEVSIVRAFIWRKYGKEKLWIKDGILHYHREINGKGKVKEFQPELIREFKILDVRPSNLIDSLNQSFWVRGGERLEFLHQAKTIRLGMQISDEQARTVFNEMKDFLNTLS
ncbi:MAG: hypothetical protein MUF75_11200 [Bacteroidia bacterium]|jgi:hypothetical protein|nr:hypothetical protein [Bacteroidia bacterium]